MLRKFVYMTTALSMLLAACAPSVGPSPVTSTPTAFPPSPTKLASGTGTPTSVVPQYGGNLTIGLDADPPNLDIQTQPTVRTAMAVGPAYNTLVQFDPTGGTNLVPSLVKSWTISSDGLVYTLKIQQGVRFSDGTAFTAEDAAWNVRRLWQPAKGTVTVIGFMLGLVKSVDAVDDETVQITLTAPFAPLLSSLSVDWATMYSKRFVEGGADPKTQVRGTGPFVLQEYTSGSQIIYKKNDSYWVSQRPYVDGLTLTIIKDRSTYLSAFRTGRILRSGRVLGTFSPSQIASLKQDVPGVQLVREATVAGPWLFFNTREKPFSDVQFRKAVHIAIDRDAAIKIIAENEGIPGTFMMPEQTGLTQQELRQIPGYRIPKTQDLALAKQLLSEANYDNQSELVILSRTDKLAHDAAVFSSEQLAQLGIKTRVEVLEDAVFWPRMQQGQFSAGVFTPAANLPDAYYMGRFFMPGGALAPQGFSDPLLVELWNRQIQERYPQTRMNVLKDIEIRLLRDWAPSAPIVWPTFYRAAWPQVRNFSPPDQPGSVNNNLQDVWLAK